MVGVECEILRFGLERFCRKDGGEKKGGGKKIKINKNKK